MRTIVAKLLILLMTLHTLVPAGYMLGRSGNDDAGPSIVICKGDVFGAPRLSPAGNLSSARNDTDPSRDHGSQLLCPFASFGATALDVATPQPVAHPVAYHAIDFFETSHAVVGTLLLRRPSARAPPFSA